MLARMSVTSMLDREVYNYAEVDRLIGLRGGTARRWINGYERSGREHDPILRLAPRNTEWVTWGEFVETRILAEYRDKDVPTRRLRAAVDSLRQIYRVDYPLAHLRPYLASMDRDLTIPTNVVVESGVAPDKFLAPRGEEHEADDLHARNEEQKTDFRAALSVEREARMVVRTQQMLLSEPSRSVIENAALAEDETGEKVVAELALDLEFPEIVTSPGRLSGQPTFMGRRVSIATIAGMASGGDRPEDLAADYGLSLVQVHAAIAYAEKHSVAA
jgi:uncharacterized protein (DUF433 family)